MPGRFDPGVTTASGGAEWALHCASLPTALEGVCASYHSPREGLHFHCASLPTALEGVCASYHTPREGVRASHHTP